MSNNKKELLQNAIADAKLVKEVAMLNAQKAIEESFAPHLKNMLSTKIQEMEDEEQQLEEAERKPDLQSVLAPYGTEKEIKSYEEKVGNDPEYDGWNEDDFIEDFKYFIQDKMDSAISDEPVEEEFDLDELLKEMSDEDIPDNPEDPNTNLVTEDEDTSAKDDEGEDDDDPEIDLENLSEEDLKAFVEEVISDMVEAGELEAGEESEDEANDDNVDDDGDLDIDLEDESVEELMEVKSKLEESNKIISELKKELNETKLLSSKLLYANKIFKSKTLNEDKKVKVLEAFNKVTSIKEAKMTYELLNENISSTNKTSSSQIKGFASKPMVLAESKIKKPILEEDALFNRMQELAGLK